MLKNRFLIEIIGWIITLVIVGLVLLPIHSNIGDNFPFYKDNIIFILISITFLRYMFLLKYHWLASSKVFKVAFVFLPIPIFFYLVDAFYNFQAFSDEEGILSILTTLHQVKQYQLSHYIRTEVVLFWAAAFLSNAYMPIRMIISLWREINKGTH